MTTFGSGTGSRAASGNRIGTATWMKKRVRSFVARGPGRPTRRIPSTPASSACKISSWYSPSDYARVRRGEITCSVRIWKRPHVKVGSRYRMDEGAIEVDSITPIGFLDITPELVANRVSLGSSICSRLRSTVKEKISIWSGFHYVRPRTKGPSQRKPT